MAIDKNLLSPYIAKRKRVYSATPKRAIEAIKEARAMVESGHKASTYSTPSFAVNRGTDGAQFFPKWDSRAQWRWIERPSTKGLRFQGYADEINSSIRHTGWFTTEDGWSGEKVRGVVYLLPHGRAVYGIDNECNGSADKDGPCMICVSDLIAVDSSQPDCQRGLEMVDAARFADSAAEAHAELERDYDSAWSAVSLAMNHVADMRWSVREALGLVRELERCDSPAVQKSIKADFCAAWDAYRDALQELMRALDNDQGVTLADL